MAHIKGTIFWGFEAHKLTDFFLEVL
jgi:hypothetical protein